MENTELLEQIEDLKKEIQEKDKRIEELVDKLSDIAYDIKQLI